MHLFNAVFTQHFHTASHWCTSFIFTAVRRTTAHVHPPLTRRRQCSCPAPGDGKVAVASTAELMQNVQRTQRHKTYIQKPRSTIVMAKLGRKPITHDRMNKYRYTGTPLPRWQYQLIGHSHTTKTNNKIYIFTGHTKIFIKVPAMGEFLACVCRHLMDGRLC